MMLASVVSAPLHAETLTPENQLISLRHIMEQSTNTTTQNATLQLIGQTGTLQAMLYAGTYLDNKAVQHQAAAAVAQIATTHPEYNGENTRQLMEQATPLLKGPLKATAKEWLKNAKKDEKGFVCLFNGKDLTGWKGLVDDPIKRSKMSSTELAERQKKADEVMHQDWAVEDGCLTYVGKGYDNICTDKSYANFEMTVDWKLDPNGAEPDAGVYLRGTPQVQIWDIRRTNVGAQVGSGGLYNNQKNESKPLSVEDNKLGEWNTFYIKMVDDKVTVKLNGVTVVDNVTLENYWDRSLPIFPAEQIEMQAHGSKVFFRDIYLKEL